MTLSLRRRSPLSPPRLPSFNSVAKSRRDFLAWLSAGAATAAVGCVVPSSRNNNNNNNDNSDGAVGAGGDLTGTDAGHAADASTFDGSTAVDADTGAPLVCNVTTKDALGPYFVPGSPIRATRIADVNEPGVRLSLEGRVLGPHCQGPLAGYSLDLWQADADGNYSDASDVDYRLRGKITTDAQGRYRFETVLPGRYGDSEGIRPAHLHVSFLSPGGNVILTTQLYFEGDPYLGQADYCTRERTCNSSDPNRILTLTNGFVSNVAGKLATFDAILPTT